MSSKAEPKGPEVERRRSPLDQLPPPANSNKPLTPFSIEDILSKPCVKRTPLVPHGENVRSGGHSPSGRELLGQSSPLCALEELASKTFRGLEVSVLQAAEGTCCCVLSGRDGAALFGQRNAPKKRRKSRTAFTNHQIYELEKRFLYQKYLSPADRDQIAQQLGLTNAQVITWFQNRRAKLKRDLEEMKADVESARAAGTVAFEKLSKLAELERCAAAGGFTPSRSEPQRVYDGRLDSNGPRTSPPSPAGRSKCCSEEEEEEEEEEEIDVDD
ncbi:transcription factor LBX1-like [Nematolebias whitei]|uniref:transcription factor LBX1-like n=1 Tax=Nematolebias whitei TaxID=451745 RepID=UPI001899B9A4|nr:transcription factor LBX1-like [Nematolebias whitei]